MTAGEVPVLTIDGPSGSGKGTISRTVARRLGWHYLDSGALYRAVGVAAGWGDLDLDDASALVRCTFDTTIDFRDDPDGELRVLVHGHDATDELRPATAGAAPSATTPLPPAPGLALPGLGGAVPGSGRGRGLGRSRPGRCQRAGALHLRHHDRLPR